MYPVIFSFESMGIYKNEKCLNKNNIGELTDVILYAKSSSYGRGAF